MKTHRELAVTLESWRTMNDSVKEVEEADLIKLLDIELTGEKRKSVIERLYGRYSYVRGQREKKQLSEYLGNGRLYGQSSRFKTVTKLEAAETSYD